MTDPRAPVFAAVRAICPANPFNDPAAVVALHNLLDAFGAERESADAFADALAEILLHEGGFVNHPSDPGGMTNLGVTRDTWRAWQGRNVTEAEMRALTPATVAPLYRKNYWQAVLADDLPAGLSLCVFDFAVNAGPGRAARYLQRLVGVPDDGVIGPVTIAAVKAYCTAHGVASAIETYQEMRRGYYRALATFPTFGRGWLRRVDEVEAKAKALA